MSSCQGQTYTLLVTALCVCRQIGTKMNRSLFILKDLVGRSSGPAIKLWRPVNGQQGSKMQHWMQHLEEQSEVQTLPILLWQHDCSNCSKASLSSGRWSQCHKLLYCPGPDRQTSSPGACPPAKWCRSITAMSTKQFRCLWKWNVCYPLDSRWPFWDWKWRSTNGWMDVGVRCLQPTNSRASNVEKPTINRPFGHDC